MTWLGKLFQTSSALLVKKYLRKSYLVLCLCNLRPFPLVIELYSRLTRRTQRMYRDSKTKAEIRGLRRRIIYRKKQLKYNATKAMYFGALRSWKPKTPNSYWNINEQNYASILVDSGENTSRARQHTAWQDTTWKGVELTWTRHGKTSVSRQLTEREWKEWAARCAMLTGRSKV